MCRFSCGVLGGGEESVYVRGDGVNGDKLVGGCSAGLSQTIEHCIDRLPKV